MSGPSPFATGFHLSGVQAGSGHTVIARMTITDFDVGILAEGGAAVEVRQARLQRGGASQYSSIGLKVSGTGTTPGLQTSLVLRTEFDNLWTAVDATNAIINVRRSEFKGDSNSINLVDCRGNVMHNRIVGGGQGVTLYAQGAWPLQAILRDNTIRGVNRGVVVGVSGAGAMSDNTIERNIISGALDYGIVIAAYSGGIDVSDVAANEIRDTGAAGMTISGPGADSRVTNNFIHGSGAAGLVPHGTTAAVRFNTVARNGAGGIGCDNTDAARVVNNLVHNNSTVGISAGSSAVRVGHNNAFANGALGDYSGSYQDQGGNLSVDPQLEAGSNIRLSASSPLIDAGGNAAVEDDFFGTARPQGAGYDIGAYEFVP